MIFADLVFLYIFLPLNLILYFAVPSVKVKQNVLLIFSLIFYAWGRPAWMLLLVATAFLDCRNARLIEKYRGTSRAKAALAASLFVDIGVFVLFKYTGFFAENLNFLFHSLLPVPDFELPIGISFYTFQTLTYVIDVYRGKTNAQKSFRKYLLYLSMYFQLVAGPIVRYTDVAKEIETPDIKASNIHAGISRFICGLAKKAIIADTAALLVKQYMEADPASLPVLAAWTGMLMYTVELYFDFSGYSDMAIGLGLIFGFHFPENFNYPYIATSVSEFWRRWHMTLGGFFRDYVYIPLGGNRKHVFINLFITWFLTGFWHGASWNFIIWGLYNGLFIALERLFKDRFERLPTAVRHLYLLLVVNFGFVFFYFKDIGRAFRYFGALFRFLPISSTDFRYTFMNFLFFIALSLLLCIPVAPYLKKRLSHFANGSVAALIVSEVLVNILLFLLLLACTAMLAGGSFSPFLYFQF